jgi:hypothetical protein
LSVRPAARRRGRDSTGGAFKGQRGFSPATSTAVVGIDLVGRQFNRRDHPPFLNTVTRGGSR